MKSFFGIKPSSPKYFDLNIDKILENWECKHAVREIIANALDEQLITKTKEIKIYKDNHDWVIRDYGRGIKAEHLTQAENQEKLNHKGVIGKFGIGLKDALATFDRHNIKVFIFSKSADISVTRTTKTGFNDIVTLHASIASPSKKIEGTEFRLIGLSDSDMEAAQKMFLNFSNPHILASTEYGEVIKSTSNGGDIYINGVLVANEPNFLFSYNINKLDSFLKRAINRERSNVGRTAYASMVRKILLSCESDEVGNYLSDDLTKFSSGQNHDELRWVDVQTHAAKIIAKQSKAVFVTSKEIQENIDLVNEATDAERKVIIIPETLSKKIEETNNTSEPQDDKKITTFTEFVKKRSENFQYEFTDEKTFSYEEKKNYDLINKVFDLIGGKPPIITGVRISETMQKDTTTFSACDGVWDHQRKQIIIYRKILADRNRFIGVLLHEIAHAKSGWTDSTRGFENELTNMLGIIAPKALLLSSL